MDKVQGEERWTRWGWKRSKSSQKQDDGTIRSMGGLSLTLARSFCLRSRFCRWLVTAGVQTKRVQGSKADRASMWRGDDLQRANSTGAGGRAMS